MHSAEVYRYLINGMIATVVHFGVLTVNLEVLKMPSAGLANVLAATVGISVSFIGSRYFVFRRPDESFLAQASRFGLLYALIASIHGAVLFGWSDVLELDYRLGFLLATGLQVSLSYLGNKRLVFST